MTAPLYLAVIMTRHRQLLDALVPLVADLTRALPAQERYARLLQSLQQLLPADAIALLRLEGDALVPQATRGLSADTLGRRFVVEAHPRLQALLAAPGAMRFPPDSPLPDPYDGLVDHPASHLEVHDCMGCALRLEQTTWGLLTVDALDAGQFAAEHLEVLEAFAQLAAATVTAAARIEALTRSVQQERTRADALLASGAPRTLLGQSGVMQALREEIALVAASDLTVLITGETGVGKELVAQSVHAASPRAAQPLVTVNCAALPETLVESELFGHVRGAFSGAVGDRRGKFEMADGGTLFLDEIGELPLGIQAKLLRVLQGGQLQRLGSDREHRVDVRLLTATNRDLPAEVRAGRFRADLYHRLSVYPLRVPPLRERDQDILLLAGGFLEENRRRMGLRGLRLTAGAQAALGRHAWPGNVRELEHQLSRATLKAMQRQATATAAGQRIVSIGNEDLDLAAPDADPGIATATPALEASTATTLREATEAFQRQLLDRALRRHGGKLAAAAAELGVDRANLARLLRRLGMR